jgi:hypothetical protein
MGVLPKMTEERLNILVSTSHCFCCGKKLQKLDRSRHHAIPQRLKPKRNIEINLCNKCHEEINNVDLAGVYSILEANKQRMKLMQKSYNTAFARLEKKDKIDSSSWFDEDRKKYENP